MGDQEPRDESNLKRVVVVLSFTLVGILVAYGFIFGGLHKELGKLLNQIGLY